MPRAARWRAVRGQTPRDAWLIVANSVKACAPVAVGRRLKEGDRDIDRVNQARDSTLLTVIAPETTAHASDHRAPWQCRVHAGRLRSREAFCRSGRASSRMIGSTLVHDGRRSRR
jgi:hypothetical protein